MILRVFLLFLKIGAVTFGGGVTMAPILLREVVEKRKWMNEDELIECFALAQSIPGVVAVNISVFVGHRISGVAGAAAAVIASIFPAIVGIICVVTLLDVFPLENVLDQGLKGVKSASVALILCTVFRMGKKVFNSKIDILLFICALFASLLFNINAIILVLLYAMLGVVGYFIYRKKGNHD